MFCVSVFHCAMLYGVFVCVVSGLCVRVFMCSGVVVEDCAMWYGLLFVLFCVCVCRLLALFACVLRLWYSVRCSIV